MFTLVCHCVPYCCVHSSSAASAALSQLGLMTLSAEPKSDREMGRMALAATLQWREGRREMGRMALAATLQWREGRREMGRMAEAATLQWREGGRGGI